MRRGVRGSLQALAWLLAALVIIALVLWSQRQSIADNVIANELASRNIPATYSVERIGGRRQVLRDIVVGDPERPDLTVERAEVRIRYTLGWPMVGRITLTRPRLYGSYRRGTLSFGTLDPLIFREPTEKKFEFPDLDLRIRDGRALLASDYGPVGLKAEGRGNLRNDFRGVVAVAAPRLAGHGCIAERSTYYGTVAIVDRRPRLSGPLRSGRLACPGQDLAVADAVAHLDARFDEELRSGEGTARLASGAVAVGPSQAMRLRADTRLVYRNKMLTMQLDGSVGGLATPAFSVADLATEGTLRARDGFSSLEYRGLIAGTGLQPGAALDTQLAGLAARAGQTLMAPLLSQARRALAAETRRSRFSADIDFRRAGELYALVVPEGRLHGSSGAALLAVSRLRVNGGGNAPPRLAGNFVTGGPGLPQIAGRMERAELGRSVLRLTMPEYRAGSAALAVPQLVLAQGSDGALGFAGTVRGSGPLPGGFVENLTVPLEGAMSSTGELALFRRCTTLRFNRFTVASLTLLEQAVSICPQPGAAILRSGGSGLRLALGTPSLDLAGKLGETPVRIRSGPIGFAYPGVMTVRGADLALGPAATASRLRIGALNARVGRDLVGTLADADLRLFATPLDVTDATGNFRYAGGRLTIADATMRVSDRAGEARFEPLVAQGATLTLADNRVDVRADLREPATDRLVTRATIRHELATGRGQADLAVNELRFDEALQPATLSRFALGTIANARGAITGTGRINWAPGGVTSTGTFSTDKLDFAAAFGPVRGLSGTVQFTDLLGMVTAPDQEVRVASLNPGIEVSEGVVRFELLPGSVLRLKSATWPFLGGTLTLAPTDLRLGVSEARRYVLLIDGLDAARFVEQMELANISATGIFDGKLPLVFSASSGTEQIGATVGALVGIGTPQGAQAAASAPGSGRIDGGILTSRPPGGNVSYVGELSRRDLSAMANFAFQTLRSLDYEKMSINLNGALEGEIVTQVRFDGVRQGRGADRNILTRAIAKLPIQFLVNIRAPFYQLITSMKALYDPAFVKDPRILGLADEQGRPIQQPAPARTGDIQRSESEAVR